MDKPMIPQAEVGDITCWETVAKMKAVEERCFVKIWTLGEKERVEARTNPMFDLKTGGKVVQTSGWLRFWGKRRKGDKGTQEKWNPQEAEKE